MMKKHTNTFAVTLLASLLVASAAHAQQYIPAPPPGMPPGPPPGWIEQGQEPTRPAFSRQELDQMLAPVALYPDALLSQVLMAATYPLEVVEAARWSRSNPSFSGEAAVLAVDGMSWDPSVKSLVAFPQVITQMDQQLDWTERLGDAFLAQQAQVMDSVQSLRQRAATAGNLRSNEQLLVERSGPNYLLESANPDQMYVPYYDPNMVYGAWDYPAYPPVYWAPPAYYGYARPSPGISLWFGRGISISAGFFFGAFDWGHRHVEVARSRPFYFRDSARFATPGVGRFAAAGPGAWQHDPAHRRGVPYSAPAVRQQFSGTAGTRFDARRGGASGAGVFAPAAAAPSREAVAPQSQAARPAAQASASVAAPARPERFAATGARPNFEQRNVEQHNAERRNFEQRNLEQRNLEQRAAQARAQQPAAVAVPRAPVAAPQASVAQRPNFEQHGRSFEGAGRAPEARSRASAQAAPPRPAAAAPAQPRVAPPAPAARPAPAPAVAPPRGGHGNRGGEEHHH